MTVADLIIELNKIEDKEINVIPVWLVNNHHHLFYIKNVEDDGDSVVLNIESAD